MRSKDPKDIQGAASIDRTAERAMRERGDKMSCTHSQTQSTHTLRSQQRMSRSNETVITASRGVSINTTMTSSRWPITLDHSGNPVCKHTHTYTHSQVYGKIQPIHTVHQVQHARRSSSSIDDAHGTRTGSYGAVNKSTHQYQRD